MPERAPDPEFVRLVVGGNTTTTRVEDGAILLHHEFGQKLTTWESYSFENDLFTPSDAFHFRVGLTTHNGKQMTASQIDDLIVATKPDTVVRLEVGQDHDLAAIGIIDDHYINLDRNGGYLEIAGRDGMSILQDNETDAKTCRLSNVTLPELTSKIVEKYQGKGIPFEVVSDNNSNRDVLTGKKKPIQSRFGDVKPKTVRTRNGNISIFGGGAVGKQDTPAEFVEQKTEEARPHAGETEYAFIARHAANLGVMLWMSADGNIIFSRPDYDQPILFELRRYLRNKTHQNNILSGGARRNTANSATTVKCLGHTSGRKSAKKQITATAAQGDVDFDTVEKIKKSVSRATTLSVTDDGRSFIWPRVKIIRDGHAKSKDRALKEARRALSRANTNLLALEYTVKGHSQDGVLYCPDTLVQVIDEACGINGVFYITSRSISKDKGKTETRLKMVPKGVIVLE